MGWPTLPKWYVCTFLNPIKYVLNLTVINLLNPEPFHPNYGHWWDNGIIYMPHPYGTVYFDYIDETIQMHKIWDWKVHKQCNLSSQVNYSGL